MVGRENDGRRRFQEGNADKLSVLESLQGQYALIARDFLFRQGYVPDGSTCRRICTANAEYNDGFGSELREECSRVSCVHFSHAPYAEQHFSPFQFSFENRL
jgi:hypothetical protein